MNTDVISYIPQKARLVVLDYLTESKVAITITRKRVTKHGDFRALPNGQSRITVNETPNPYRFLITLIHELAHFKAYERFGRRIKPHGYEWKQEFRTAMLPLLRPDVFPKKILSVLALHLKNPKASTDSDFALAMAVKAYDAKTHKTHIFELEEGTHFSIHNGRQFVKGKKRRKRFECKEFPSGRTYLFSPHAEVDKIS